MRKRPLPSKPVPEPETSSRRRKLAPVKPAASVPKAPRTLMIGTGSIISVLVLILLLGSWGVGMTLMLLFGDRLSERLITQNSEMQDAYEQRLQAYRAEIARVVQEMEQSKFDQNSVEGRVIELGRRQRLIEARLQALNRLSDLVAPGLVGGSPGLRPASPAPAAPDTPGRNSPPQPPSLSTPPAGGQNRTNRSSLEDDKPTVHLAQFLGVPAVEPAPLKADADLEIFIERMESALKRAEQLQGNVLGSLVRLSEIRVDRLRTALRDIGMTPETVAPPRGRTEPNLPGIILPISDQTGPFAERVGQIRSNFGLMHRIRYTIDALPISKPTIDEVRYSSGFGYRVHPILGYQRLHAGVDMAAPIGTPIRAAGAGVVSSAGWGGGYGNLIMIDHGNGIVTRYAHLSQMDVAAGQPVSAGVLIGRMGTTGASTGSHLHFETRINGTPSNPACFLLAGDRIFGRQTVPLACDKPPTWQKPSKSEEEDDDS
jgi:murein DD-endopeptidase MepM/ murein hydrolase activator NlpD